ncbi:hypothetical protein F0U59_26825 [Archangium gephyra]|nr:hypothetical protein F0U59_26825 [Archangium gephyra]
MATKKKLRTHQALRLAQDAVREYWWRCRDTKCLFTTPDDGKAAVHAQRTGHVVGATFTIAAPHPRVPELTPAARALNDASAIRETLADLLMWVDALANDFPNVGATPATLNELLLCTVKVGSALDDAHPVSEDLVNMLRKLERRERDRTARTADSKPVNHYAADSSSYTACLHPRDRVTSNGDTVSGNAGSTTCPFCRDTQEWQKAEAAEEASAEQAMNGVTRRKGGRHAR